MHACARERERERESVRPQIHLYYFYKTFLTFTCHVVGVQSDHGRVKVIKGGEIVHVSLFWDTRYVEDLLFIGLVTNSYKKETNLCIHLKV